MRVHNIGLLIGLDVSCITHVNKRRYIDNIINNMNPHPDYVSEWLRWDKTIICVLSYSHCAKYATMFVVFSMIYRSVFLFILCNFVSGSPALVENFKIPPSHNDGKIDPDELRNVVSILWIYQLILHKLCSLNHYKFIDRFV